MCKKFSQHQILIWRSLSLLTGITFSKNHLSGYLFFQKSPKEGATVVINYSHSADKAETTVKEIEQQGGKAIAFWGDNHLKSPFKLRTTS
ncbi:MAG: hypothetical protein ACRC8K_12015 [Waterburya sp.]